jgi:hypothetical protein
MFRQAGDLAPEDRALLGDRIQTLLMRRRKGRLNEIRESLNDA